MKKNILYFSISIVFLFVLILLDIINHNRIENVIQYIQEKIIECERNIERSNEEVLMIEKVDKPIIHSLYDWGIYDMDDVFNKHFIVNHTGWYWVIHRSNKIYILRFKYAYPVSNEYLQEHYARCLNIPVEYKLEYSESSKQFKDVSGKYLPLKVIQYPKYRYNWLVNLNAWGFVVWSILVCYFLTQIARRQWGLWVLWGLWMCLRWIIYQLNVLPLLQESWWYDVKLYAFPHLYFMQSYADVCITVCGYLILSHRWYALSRNIWIQYANIFLSAALIWAYIYLFTHHSSFTFNIIDGLFDAYPYWWQSVLALFFLISFIIQFTVNIQRYVLHFLSIYQTGILFLFILLVCTSLIFYYQNNNLKSKVEYLVDWIENEEQIALLEQAQIIDKKLNHLSSLHDSIYFKAITEIENTSIYLKLSKRYLFEDSISAYRFLSDKKEIWKYLYIDDVHINTQQNTIISHIYYLNKIDKKYLLSVFEYFLPFSDKNRYSFLADRIFQLPSGFRNFDIAVYEHQKLKFNIGTFPFPLNFSDMTSMQKIYPYNSYMIKSSDDKHIVISYYEPLWKDLLSLFSTYFVLVVTLMLAYFYTYYVFQYRSLFPLKYISYSYKITGLVMFILTFSFYLLFIVSYKYVYRLLEKNVQSQLIKQYQSFNIHSYGDNVFLFDEYGQIYPQYTQHILIKFKLIPSQLPVEWVKNIQQKKIMFEKRRIGKYTYTSLFMWQTDMRSSRIIELAYFEEASYFSKNLHSLLSPLSNIYAVLFLLSFIAGIVLSNYITFPIMRIAKSLKTDTSPLDLKIISHTSEDELGELVKNYNVLVYRLQELMEQLKKEQQEKAWKLMAQQIAHDIKNSLTPLYLNVQYLHTHLSNSDKANQIVLAIIQQIHMLSRIAEDFLEYAQEIKVNYEQMDIEKFLRDIVSQYQGHTHIRIQYHIASDVNKVIYTDRYLLSRVLNNLINNSIEAIYEEGDIVISVYTEEQSTVMSIKDNGCGIPIDMQQKIFEPKFSTKTSGKGLGLSIVKSICEKLGIDISFYSEEHKGTIFYLKFS